VSKIFLVRTVLIFWREWDREQADSKAKPSLESLQAAEEISNGDMKALENFSKKAHV